MDSPLIKEGLRLKESFDNLRSLHKNDIGDLFWDMVVISASDDAQRHAYEIQIENKLKKKEIPQGVIYKVISDPPGPKIGNGGSTINVLRKIDQEYGSIVENWKILLIHAGGQSKRLPSASLLGKLFTPVPISSILRDGSVALYQQLEIKLMNYLSLIPLLSAGYFLAPSDDLEIFGCSDVKADQIPLISNGVLALGHTSSIEVGYGHGVYVFDSMLDENLNGVLPCKKVLQKPSLIRMQKENAIFELNDGNSCVITDSAFFFDHKMSKTLMTCFTNGGIPKCEIDAYGDFLQALGTSSTNDYIHDLKNISTIENGLIEGRETVFNALRAVDLYVLILNPSKFYHFGTIKEYLYNFCENDVIRSEMGFEKTCFSRISQHSATTELATDEHTSRGCIMYCNLIQGIQTGNSTVLEYCDFNYPFHFGDNSLISGCQYIFDSTPYLQNIPNNIFISTTPVNISGKTAYTTIFFSVLDDLKASVMANCKENLQFMGKSLTDLKTVLHLSSLNDFFDIDCSSYSLWNAKLFPLCDDMSTSFNNALITIGALDSLNFSDGCQFSNKVSISMSDIIESKNLDVMINYRDNLSAKIRGFSDQSDEP